MMLLGELGDIKKYVDNDEEKARIIIKEINKLSNNDIITSTLLARKTRINLEQARNILDFLVKQNELEFFIVVDCINPETKNLNEINHYKYFNSLGEFNEFSKDDECPICGCGYSYDLKNAKIGFRILRK